MFIFFNKSFIKDKKETSAYFFAMHRRSFKLIGNNWSVKNWRSTALYLDWKKQKMTFYWLFWRIFDVKHIFMWTADNYTQATEENLSKNDRCLVE